MRKADYELYNKTVSIYGRLVFHVLKDQGLTLKAAYAQVKAEYPLIREVWPEHVKNWAVAHLEKPTTGESDAYLKMPLTLSANAQLLEKCWNLN